MSFDTCERCKLRPSLCHGADGFFGVAGCLSFDHKRCKDWGWTCVCDPEQLDYRLREVGGFDCVVRGSLRVTPALPHFIPTMYHRVSRRSLFDLDWVALPLHVLFTRNPEGSLNVISETAVGLRAELGLRRSTKIVVTGPGPDQALEDFWRFHRSGKLFQRLIELEIELFTVPNFSFFLDSPPLHYRYNRSRILRVAERASEAGLSAVIHLNALHEEEWRDWERLLIAHPEISAVCLEFQTGYSSPVLGTKAFERLVRLRHNIGRPLHPIIIGGARFAAELGKNFESSTLIDAQPFLKTFHRKDCWIDSSGRLQWRFKRSQPGEDLGGRFSGNLRTYSQRLAQRLKGQKPAHQTDFGFRLDNSGPMRPSGKQHSTADLPLFAIRPTPPRSGVRQVSRSRYEPPSVAPVSHRTSDGSAPLPAKLAPEATRTNSRRKSNLRIQRPSASGARNTGRVADLH